MLWSEIYGSIFARVLDSYCKTCSLIFPRPWWSSWLEVICVKYLKCLHIRSPRVLLMWPMYQATARIKSLLCRRSADWRSCVSSGKDFNTSTLEKKLIALLMPQFSIVLVNKMLFILLVGQCFQYISTLPLKDFAVSAPNMQLHPLLIRPYFYRTKVDRQKYISCIT